jgi:signal transduction histidine kinase
MSPHRPKKLPRAAASGMAGGAAAHGSGAEAERQRAHRRLEQLVEISKLFATFENVEESFDPAMRIVGETLPLRSVMLLEAATDHSRILAWPRVGLDREQMAAARTHAEDAYAYLIGKVADDPVAFSEQQDGVPVPWTRGADPGQVGRYIVIPLVVARQPIFGILQLETAHPGDKDDLRFVNVVANQLAVTLDRDRAWGRDIARRKLAEARGASAEHGRVVAEHEREHFEVLAAENSRLAQQAQQAVRVREQILAVVSHDLKNPLSTILLASNALVKWEGLKEPRAALPQSAFRMLRAAERMQRLIGDLLDFASIEAGRLSIARQPESPSAIINETVSSFEGAAQAKGVRLVASAAPELPRALCDRGRILQVLSNLVGNALSVTPEGGQVGLLAEARDRELLFAVTDTGKGLSQEDLKHLFERYWRSEEASYQGTGLGLAIAQGIVAAHGGHIWAESELGRGSAFYFTVPAS